MRVLLLVTDAYGGHGGIAYYNRCLTEALAEIPEVTEIVVVPRAIRFAPAGMPSKVRFVAHAAGRKWKFIRAVASLAARHFDLLICGHINLLPLAVPLAKLKRVPAVLQVHGIDVWEQPAASLAFWARQVDAVWSVSGVTRDRMNSWAKLPASTYTIIPNTIHLDRYGLAPKRSELVARYQLAGRKVIMTLARLAGDERYKGIDEILEVLGALLIHDPTLIYLIVGDGDDEARLRAKAALLGVADNVVFVGFVEEAEKADYLRLADVFALPGRGEGFGIVFLEALACGVPAVGSQLDGSREALRGGELGELADPRDPASIKACILRTLARPKGVPPGLAYFGWPNFQARLARAVSSLVPAKGPQNP
ncbi:MAG: glycosyltransferase family 4 protein [Burkholderiaceae bacterium]|nr:glycosyltransferase family 4 protein [Burkholderiaceae bacterium]